MDTWKILVIGASGYIGGSVLTALMKSSHPLLRECEFTALVRHEPHADALRHKGINVLMFSGLDDLDIVREVAARHDIVINTASTFHTPVAKSIIDGLGDRKTAAEKQTHLIQTSGTGSLADRPVSKRFVETKVFSDKDNIYDYEKYRESIEPFPQRTTDVTVIEHGESTGVKTYIVMSPTIYGLGSGVINQKSMQIEALIRAARDDKYVSVVGSGESEWSHVHIEDLGLLYELLVTRILGGLDLPSNKHGIYFSETGYETWRAVSEHIARTGKELGILPSQEIRQITLEEGSVKLIQSMGPDIIELGWASRSRTKADRSREIGWKPTKSFGDFLDSFTTLWAEIMKE
ncbi:NAD dependent epimerase/dehydratase family protein [Dactylonectria estremocensis]|uniref:NAD dependent epimerase/dehydratase family protein n=1 Tax=Dactylonectria estremocensis TaxID=1079267 RepID=A0A9P9F2I3_9HYPO|nr:NAD dependent epimerase/dehydratase family protein [Dactylonectria estremocensis]